MIKNDHSIKNSVYLFFFIILLLPSMSLAYKFCKQDQLQKGRCVDIGGYQLYIETAGNVGPNIIFESGLGDTSSSWDKVVPQVMKFAHTVVYDRNGLGESQSKPNEKQPRTAQQVVDNLRVVLAKNHIGPPYILVGHSMGGLYMQLFAQKYPNEVAGVVLVDSATREQSGNEPLPFKDASYYLEAKGIKASIEQVKDAPPFPAVPLIILTTEQRGPEWLSLQKGLLELSPFSEQVTTTNSGHYIQREEPELVVNALKAMLNKLANPEQQLMLPITNFIAARNKHDIGASLEPFADNIVWLTSWNEILSGKDALRKMFIKQFKDNITNQIISQPQINKNKITFQRRVTMDSWQLMGIEYLIEDTEVIIENAKIVYFKSQYTTESATKLKAANRK